MEILNKILAQVESPQHKYNNIYISCPLHEDKTPSLSISEDKKCFHCFSCNEKGTLNYLAELMGLKDKFKPIQKKTKKTTSYQAPIKIKNIYHPTMMDVFLKRHVSYVTARNHGVLYVPKENKIIFQFLNKNKTICYGNIYQNLNRMNSQPKYLIQKNFKKNKCLYNEMDLNKDYIIITEGTYDCLSLVTLLEKTKVGVVALCGSTISETQALKLQNKTCFLLMDPDQAGITASKKIKNILDKFTKNTYNINLKKLTKINKDVNDLLITHNQIFYELLNQILKRC